MLAHPGLHGADVVAGQEVPVGVLAAPAVAGAPDELLLLGQVAAADGVLRPGLDRVGPAEVGVTDRVALRQQVITRELVRPDQRPVLPLNLYPIAGRPRSRTSPLRQGVALTG